MTDESLAALALFLRYNPKTWTILDEIVVEDSASEVAVAMSLTSWAVEIVAGHGVWAPTAAFAAKVQADRPVPGKPRVVRLWGCYMGEPGVGQGHADQDQETSPVE